MTAVILAGGDGRRMKPLNCSAPKAALKICGIPLFDYALRLMNENGADRVIIAADKPMSPISDYYDRPQKLPLYSISNSPQGTSAALSAAAESYDIPADEPVAVLFADALTDFSVKDIVRFHKYNDCTITAVLKKFGEGVRPCDKLSATVENGFLTSVYTDLPRESTLADGFLTGLFIISGGMAREMKKYGGDILSEAFPKLITDGIKINAVFREGYYRDVKTPADFHAACGDALNGVFTRRYAEINETEGAKIYLGDGTEISESVKISGFASIGGRVTIGKGSKLHNCVIFDNSYIGERCTINGAVIGKNARVCSGAAVFEGAVIGGNAVIAEDACVKSGVKIWEGRHVEPFSCAETDLKYGFSKPVVIDDDGITGETNGFITPRSAALTGSALAGIGGKIGIGFRSGSNASLSLALAAAAGVMSAGGDVWFFGATTEPELAWCIRKCGLNAGCCIEAGINAKIRFFSGDGMSLSREEEKIIEGALNRSEFRRSGYGKFGSIYESGAIRRLYRTSLEALRPRQLKSIRAIISTSGERVAEICGELIGNVNNLGGNPIVFHIAADGVKVSAYTDETGYVFHEKLIMLCLQRRFKAGRDAAVPFDYPFAAEELAEKHGRRVLRMSGCTDFRGGDERARSLGAECPFLTDGAALMAEVLDILNEGELTLREACASLPEFATVNRFVAFDVTDGGNLGRLRSLCSSCTRDADGIRINDNRGRVLIRPVKTGRGVMMHVESYAAEIASELCDFYQDRLLKG